MTTRLQIYNGALLLIGERHLASLTEARKPRYVLDKVWTDNGVQYCLEQGQWDFAIRAAKLTYDPDFASNWGYQRAFPKPTDYVNTAGVCQDEYLNIPLTRYKDEVNYWFADLDVIYVRYVSNHADYGMNLGRWPAAFTEYVKAHFAARIVRDMTNDAREIDKITHPDKGVEALARLTALSQNSQQNPTSFPAQGRWSRARRGSSGVGWDRGNPNALIGG